MSVIHDTANRIYGVVEKSVEKTVARRLAIDQTEPFNWTIHSFRKFLLLITESRCVTRLSCDGEVIKESGEHTDYYGYLTSIGDPLGVALKWLQQYGDKPHFRVELLLTVESFYGVVIPASEENSRQYRAVPQDWVDCRNDEDERILQKWASVTDMAESFALRSQLNFLSEWRPSTEVALIDTHTPNTSGHLQNVKTAIRLFGEGALKPKDLQNRFDMVDDVARETEYPLEPVVDPQNSDPL